MTNWLTDWLTYSLIMPSDKHNPITARAMDFIFALIGIVLSQDVPFRQPQQLQHLHHGFIKAYLCFHRAPFLSPLPRRWRFVVRALWLQCETCASAVLAGALLKLFFAWNVALRVLRAGSEMKHSDAPWSSNTPTFKLITGAHTLMIRHSIFPIIAELIVEILFMLFSVYNVVWWTENEWIWSILANEFSTN